MTPEGWIFMGICWAVVILTGGWCLYRVVTSHQHWKHPQDDIERLHHGEFTGQDREADEPHPPRNQR